MKKKLVHPAVQRYLESSPLTNMPSMEKTPIREIREFFDAAQQKMNTPVFDSDLLIENSFTPTKQGKMAIRAYKPKSGDFLSRVIFFHGGGFVFGNLDTLDSYCRELAVRANSEIISIDYPLAPENRFPIPVDASFDALCQIARANTTPLFVAGSSSGATMAAVMAMMCRDKQGPMLSGQILLCPMTDTDFKTRSHKENGSAYNLTTEHCKWFYSQYAQSPKDYQHPYFAPLKADSFSNLPAALVIAAELDPLYDEGKAYARRLKEAGAPVINLCYEGMIHGFYSLPLEDLPEKKIVFEQIKDFLKNNS